MLHMCQLFQSMKKFITHVEKFSEESRTVSKLVWIWLEGAERGDFLRVYGVWGGCVGGRVKHPSCGQLLYTLNFPWAPKEWAAGLSNQFFPDVGHREQRSGGAWKLSSNIKNGARSFMLHLYFQIIPSCCWTLIVPQPRKDLPFTDPTTFFLTLVSPSSIPSS